jgi:hypothetical protein
MILSPGRSVLSFFHCLSAIRSVHVVACIYLGAARVRVISSPPRQNIPSAVGSSFSFRYPPGKICEMGFYSKVVGMACQYSSYARAISCHAFPIPLFPPPLPSMFVHVPLEHLLVLANHDGIRRKRLVSELMLRTRHAAIRIHRSCTSSRGFPRNKNSRTDRSASSFDQLGLKRSEF